MKPKIKPPFKELIFLFIIFVNVYPSQTTAQSTINKNSEFCDVKINQHFIFNLKYNHFNHESTFANNFNSHFLDSLAKVQQKKIGFCKGVKQEFNNYSSDLWYVTSAPSRINKKSTLMLGGILAIGGVIFIYDEAIANAVDRNRNNDVYETFVDVANVVEPMGISQYTIPISFGCYIIGYALKFESMKDISFQIFESLTIGVIFKNIIANSIGRARPNSGKGPRFSKFGGSASFFSGHVSNAFQVARILSHHVNFLPFKIICYGSALLVGFHRLDDEMHWASDVFIGAIYGTTVASAILKLKEKRKIKVVPNISPNQSYLGLRVSYQF